MSDAKIGLRAIAGQVVDAGRSFVRGASSYAGGTQIAHPQRQGMSPSDWKAYRRIAKQAVAGGVGGYRHTAATGRRDSAGGYDGQGVTNERAASGGSSYVGGTAIRSAGTFGMRREDFEVFSRIANQEVTRKRDEAEGRDGTDVEDASSSKPRQTKRDKDKALVETVKERFRQAAESESEIRKLALDDLRFFNGDQWDQGVRASRMADGRPCLTINRLPQFVRQVTNEQRQNQSSVQVNPIDDDADPETAEIIEGLIRHIEYDSGADAAYDTAFFGAATCGFGYFRVLTEYSGPMSFDQDIKIARVRNPFTVYLDPNAKDPDYGDAEWGIVVETLSKEAFEASYPDTELTDRDDWGSIGTAEDDWVEKDAVRIAEYWWREQEHETLCQLRGGATVLKSELPKEFDELVESRRPTTVTKVKFLKTNGIEILERGEWAGRWIPIIKVVGDELDVDGKLMLKGIVRDAQEPQRQYNFMKSASTEAIALAPKAPFVGAEGQFAGREQEWGRANVTNAAYLQYKPIAIGGVHAPPPQRMSVEPAIQAITHATLESADDLKAVTGIYDAALGAQGNETSGKAILARQQQAQGSNFHYGDNLTRAKRHCYRVVLDLIPHVYDVPRVIRIVGGEGEQKAIGINGAQKTGAPDVALQKVYDVTVGTYDVTINTGPSYQSRRQEAVSSILDLTKNFPQLMGVAGDILVNNMDWPGAQEIAKRLRASMPPALVQDDDSNPLPPEAQQHIAQLTQQLQQVQQALQAAQQDVQQHVSVKRMEIDHKERIVAAEHRLKEAELQIEATKVQAMILAAQVKVDAGTSDREAQRSYDAMSQLAAQQHAQAMQVGDQSHEAAMAQMQQEHGLETAADQANADGNTQISQQQGDASTGDEQ